jgi:16S rRNA processing protein RimM
MAHTSTHDSSLFCAAVIATAHGVRGHVKVKCFMEDPSQFKTYSPYSNESGEVSYVVEKVISQTKDILIVSLKGVQDRTQAEHLRGAQLMLSRERLPNLSEDTFYHRDLIGLEVLSVTGDRLGVVHALHKYGAGDILEVQTSDDKLEMIPFTKKSVPEVDLQKGCLVLSKEGETFLKGGNYVS